MAKKNDISECNGLQQIIIERMMFTMKIKIPESEFYNRIGSVKEKMVETKLNAVLIYGDEYRKENLRYVSNYWPMFERGALLISNNTEPVLLCAPEGEKAAIEMSVIKDIRLLPDFLCVTVPDEIDYPHAKYTSFLKLAGEIGGVKRLGIAGIDAMSVQLYNSIEKAFNAEIIDINWILNDLRIRKSQNEINCLKEASRIADIGYRALMEACVPGRTELEVTGAAEGAARSAGAEFIVFTVFGSGKRSETIIGRPCDKVIEEGDMIMASLAVQYEGYVATVEIPFVAGNASLKSKQVIDVLVKAEAEGLPYLKAGEKMSNFVKAVKDYFRKEGLEKYDIYPPLHGCGCAEAESPYPNETTEDVFEVGMTVNTDISLFGLEGGSNRIEEGFIITKKGAEAMSSTIREFCEKWIREN